MYATLLKTINFVIFLYQRVCLIQYIRMSFDRIAQDLQCPVYTTPYFRYDLKVI